MIPIWLFIFFVVDVVAAAVIWTWINLSPAIKGNLQHQLGPLQDGDAEAQGRVAVLSPGRNEADHLTRTLPAMCEQTDSDYRVVFIDDASDDETPAITAEFMQRYANLSVVRLEDGPPEGWVGKCWALQSGYDHLQKLEAAGEPKAAYILFADADIDWQPDTLRGARQVMAKHDADVVGLFPKLRFGSPVEAIVQLQMMLALGIIFPIDKAMDPDHPDTLTGGAFILVRRNFYDKIGQHHAIRDEMVDDINLGRRLKAEGAKVRLTFAPHLLSCRMYEGFADQWEGLTKNAFAGLDCSRLKTIGLSLAALLINVLPPVYLVLAAMWCASGLTVLNSATLGLAVLAVLMQARALNAARKIAELPWWYAWTLPLGSAIYIVILLWSMAQHHRGGNRWKDRQFKSAAR